jgi:hypothetical protein
MKQLRKQQVVGRVPVLAPQWKVRFASRKTSVFCALPPTLFPRLDMNQLAMGGYLHYDG